jgi:rhodanese-related sulfurtransferase
VPTGGEAFATRKQRREVLFENATGCVTLSSTMKLVLSLVAAVAALALTACSQSASTPTPPATAVQHVDPDGAARRLADTNVVVLDIRTPDEFKTGHIRGAKLVDFRSADFAKKVGELDRSKTYVVHCASGRRSASSLETFQKLGFKSIVHLDGGFNAWKSAGKPVEN